MNERRNDTITPPPLILRVLSAIEGVGPETADYHPDRVRGVIFNSTGDSVIGIRRVHPSEDVYAVFPGGGLDSDDASPIKGLWRELAEEVGISSEDVVLTGDVIEFGHERFYIGHAITSIDLGQIGGPESERDLVTAGLYTLSWIKVADLESENAQPLEVIAIISGAHREMNAE